MTKLITENIRQKFQDIRVELNDKHKERVPTIDLALVALVARFHYLMLGAPGTGKSFLVDDLMSRVTGVNKFKTQLHEDSKADYLVGAPDIPALVESGQARVLYKGMLPDAFLAFIGEIGNANAPILHNLLPLLNERIFFEGGINEQTGQRDVVKTDLWTVYMDTNFLFDDPKVQAVWDRVHFRDEVTYVKNRENLRDILRMTRGRHLVGKALVEEKTTTLTRDEIVQAHNEALSIPFPQDVEDTLFDMAEELQSLGVEVSTRRLMQVGVAVSANAWFRGHETVRVGDLDVAVSMLWNTLSDRDVVSEVILTTTNPSEKAALEALDDLDKLLADYRETENMDERKRNNAGLEIYKNCKRLLTDLEPMKTRAEEVGSSTRRIDEALERTTKLMGDIGQEIFGIEPEKAAKMQKVGA